MSTNKYQNGKVIIITDTLLLFVLLTGCVNKDAGVAGEQKSSATLRLHPENGHYFQYKGKTLVLVTSGEHYGAVINRDFDYKKYLETLSRDGMNSEQLTRITGLKS